MKKKVRVVEAQKVELPKVPSNTTDDQLKRAFEDALKDMADTRKRSLRAMHLEVTWYHCLLAEMQARKLKL